jgi:4-coumarate--CoA ligase
MEEILKGITIPSPFGENETLGSVLLNFLDKTPNKVAQVCYEDGIEMTCVEMNILSVRIAKNLLKIGIKKGDVAILAVKNTSYLTPLIIASSLVGCTIAPVNIADLENDFKAFPKFFQPKLIFCTSSAVPEINGLLKIHKFTCEIVTLDSGSQIPTEHMNIFDFIKHMEDENNFR